MNNVLFSEEERAGRCCCLEKSKPLSKRSLSIYAYYPRRVWGKAIGRYDGRKLLRVTCNVCCKTWKEYNPNSSLWGLIKDSPYGGEEKRSVLNG